MILAVPLLGIAQSHPRAYIVSEYTSDTDPSWVVTITEIDGGTARRIELTRGAGPCDAGRLIIRAAETTIDPGRNPFADLCTRSLAGHRGSASDAFDSIRMSVVAACSGGDRLLQLERFSPRSLPPGWITLLRQADDLDAVLGPAWALGSRLAADKDLALQKAGVGSADRIRSGAYDAGLRRGLLAELNGYQGPQPIAMPRVTIDSLESLGVTHLQMPVYPDKALSRKTEDSVGLRITVDDGGRPVKIEPRWGPYSMSQSALAAVRQWRFVADAPKSVDVRIVFSVECVR